MEKQALPPVLSPQTAKSGWCWMAFQLLLLPQLVSSAAGLLPISLNEAGVNLCYHMVCFLAVFSIFQKYLWDSCRWAKLHWKRFALVCLLALAGYYAASWGLTRLIVHLEPSFSNRNDQTILHLRQQGLFLTALATVLFAPLSEECLFRGLLFGEARKRSRWGAYLLSALCFALLHMLGYFGTYTPLQLMLSLVQYLPAGLILAWSYEKSQTLAAPIAIHTIINAISMVQIL